MVTLDASYNFVLFSLCVKIPQCTILLNAKALYLTLLSCFIFVLSEFVRRKLLKREVTEAYRKLKSTVDKCLSLSSYSEVNLGKLFSISMGRSIRESSSERQ